MQFEKPIGATPYVTIKPDGSIEFSEGYTPTEAAREFWAALGACSITAQAALQPFADFTKGRAADMLPDDTVISAGSLFARRQLTMGDCRAAARALGLRK